MGIYSCTITNNAATNGNGGGINNNGTMTINNSTIANNTASGLGGGIRNVSGPSTSTTNSSLTITNSAIIGNTAGVAGGGVDSAQPYASPTTTTSLTNVTISGNSAPTGGGVYNTGGALTLTSATVSGNSATSSAGGLFSTLSTPVLINTIVAGNTGSSGASDIVAGSGVTGTNNLIGTGGSGGLVNGVNGNIVGVANPLLGPLGFYGGTTETIPLLPGSLAIDNGTTGTGVPTTDQRGLSPVGGVDIGAFESQGFTLTVVSGSSPQSTAPGTAFPKPLTVIVTANNPVEPVNGGVITFTAPISNASATLSSTTAVIANGQASVTATANSIMGTYNVSANARGVGSPALFALTNMTPAAGLYVTQFVTTSTGFTVTFSEPFVLANIHLYTTAAANLGPADVTLVGASTGPVTGSLIVNSTNTGFTFVATGKILAPDTYTVTLLSGANAFVDASGNPLQGTIGSPGTNYTTSFTVAPECGANPCHPRLRPGPWPTHCHPRRHWDRTAAHHQRRHQRHVHQPDPHLQSQFAHHYRSQPGDLRSRRFLGHHQSLDPWRGPADLHLAHRSAGGPG